MGLYTTDSLVPLARAIVAGPPGQPERADRLGDVEAARRHLAHGTPPTPTLEAITTRSVDALRAYLDGERGVVAGRADEAQADYGRAIAADSTFWFAYFRLGNVAGMVRRQASIRHDQAYWSHRAPPPPPRAHAHRGHPRRQRTLLAARAARGDRPQYPDYWPAWLMLGDGLVHSYPYIGSPARTPGGRWSGWSSSIRGGGAWGHLAWIYQTDRDTARLARSLDAVDRLGGGPRSSSRTRGPTSPPLPDRPGTSRRAVGRAISPGQPVSHGHGINCKGRWLSA